MALATRRSLGHEVGLAQQAQVLGDGRAAELELPGEVAGGAGALDEQLEQPSAHGVPESAEDEVDGHARKICRKYPTCQLFPTCRGCPGLP